MREPTGFVARPWWERWLRRQWRRLILCRLPGNDRHGLPRKGYRYVVPPSEWSQESADRAIRRGQELAQTYGWDMSEGDSPHRPNGAAATRQDSPEFSPSVSPGEPS